MTPDIKTEIANYLLNNCFLVGTEDRMKERYYYVLNHEADFQKIFSPIGYTLNINRSLKVVQLINSYGYGRVSFRKYESIILLILRLLYIEKREKLTTNTEKVYVTAAEIKTEFEKLNLPKKFDQRLLEDSLTIIKRFNIAFFTGKLESSDSTILILPSIMLAVPDAVISQQYESIGEMLRQYESSKEDEE